MEKRNLEGKFGKEDIYIYIAKHYTSPRLGNRASDRVPRPRPTCPHDWFLHHARLTESHARLRRSESACPRWPHTTWSKPHPDRVDAALTEPMDLTRPRPRATQTFFVVRSAILRKRHLFLSFRTVILLHRCYSAQLFLLQCSAILENLVIFSLS
jgi:hypothetical protein